MPEEGFVKSALPASLHFALIVCVELFILLLIHNLELF